LSAATSAAVLVVVVVVVRREAQKQQRGRIEPSSAALCAHDVVQRARVDCVELGLGRLAACVGGGDAMGLACEERALCIMTAGALAASAEVDRNDTVCTRIRIIHPQNQ
jgi:hypothetical protein